VPVPQHLEAGEMVQGRPLRSAKFVKLLAPRFGRAAAEPLKRSAQPAPFQRRDGGVVDQIAGAGVAAAGFAEIRWRKFRDRLHVDVEGIEKQPAVRGCGPVVEQDVQRIEANAAPPSSRASSTIRAKSVKSPIPQLRSERTL
jgi:hypothetical protein